MNQEKKEKHTSELDKYLDQEDAVTTELYSKDYIIENVLPLVKKVIGSIKAENISSDMSVTMGELCFKLGLSENSKYYFAMANELNHDNMNARKTLDTPYENTDQIAEHEKNDPDEKVKLRDMRAYWDACARDNAMRHIAVDDWETEEIFHKCGERDLDNLLRNIDREYLKTGRYRVLEIGCGIGRMLKPFAAKYPNLEIYGVDVSEEMIRKGKQRNSEFRNIKLFANNGKDLNMFEDSFFHLIYSYIVFQHIPRKFVHDYFKEVGRKLVKSGVLIFQMPLKPDDIELKDPPDTDFRTIRHYSIKEVDKLCNSNGLSIVKEKIISANEKYPASAWFTAVKIKQ